LGFPGETTAGGVTCRGDAHAVQTINLCSRIAGRVLLRIARFEARSFAALEKALREVRFDAQLSSRAALAVRVTCHRSRLYHTKAVAERVYATLGATAASPSNLDEDDEPPPTLLVRIDHDICTLSLDTSGAHLHKRGYRLATAKAPMRETLAATVLADAGYDGSTAFVDPMCGSGTLAIEAALLARRRAPGILRSFAFQRWPSFDARACERIVEKARAGERQAPAVIAASDLDSGAVEAARANAQRAGVSIELAVLPLSRATPPAERGVLLANPPYGARIGDPGRLRDLYAALGNLARGPFARWTSGFVTSDARLARAAGEDFTAEHPPLAHGGLKIKLWIRTPS